MKNQKFNLANNFYYCLKVRKSDIYNNFNKIELHHNIEQENEKFKYWRTTK